MNSETIYRRRWWILVVLALSVFLVVVDNTIVNVALPTLSRDLNASTTDLQWIVDAYSLVFAGLLLAAGGLGDRIGRKGTMQVGLVVFAATSVVAAFSTSSGQLIASRAAMGIGAALVFPATLAILTNVFTDPTERAKAIGAWSAVSGMAVAFGPVTGGILLEHFWWGSIFLVNVPIVAIALLAGWFLVPTSRDPDSGAFDWVGTVVSILGVGLLVYTVIEGPHAGWNSVATIGGFIGAAVLLAVFVVYELRREHPLLDVRVFRIYFHRHAVFPVRTRVLNVVCGSSYPSVCDLRRDHRAKRGAACSAVWTAACSGNWSAYDDDWLHHHRFLRCRYGVLRTSRDFDGVHRNGSFARYVTLNRSGHVVIAERKSRRGCSSQ